MLSQEQLDEIRVQKRLLKDVRSAQNGREASVQRLAAAKKQGLKIPSMQEAREAMKRHVEAEASRGKRKATSS